jgi:1-acyl-sn-glycerol-3-phosphate acyltransferase
MTALLVGSAPTRERTHRALLRTVRFLLHLCTRRTQVGSEGAITRDPQHWPGRGKTGVVRLALDTGAPIVPLAQWGTHRFVGAEGTRWKALLSPLTRPRVDVRFGPPLDLRALLGVHSAAAADAGQLRRGADLVMAALVAELVLLCGEQPPAGQ